MTTRVDDDGFVLHPDLGLGWLDATTRTLRFFDSPAAPELLVPVSDHEVTPAVLQKQQRVWRHDGSRWMVGRVDSPGLNGPSEYHVHFPNGRTELVPAGTLKVRWSQPVEDPVGLLTTGAVETRFFHDKRSAFLESVTEQRAACEGLGGIMSSAVELHAHQIGAARRVLMDPVRRYLLADEVGLGKTIEAGMVLRQLLLDEPGEALVLVPSSLVGQWEDELATKFRIGQFGPRVRVLPHTAVDSVDAEKRLLVIVDEAHRLTEDLGNDERATVYSRLAELAHSSTSLLLLSATPVRSNEDAFLRLLHLLDPSTYPLSDLDAFRRRVAIRDDLAEALAAMDDETPIAYLLDPAEQLRPLLPDDELLGDLVAQLAVAVENMNERDARAICRRMRTHLGETYRIHRRLIRTRRTASLMKTFPVRGRQHDAEWLLSDPDPRRADVLTIVDGLRSSIAGRDEPAARSAFRVILGRALGPMTALGDLAACLRGAPGHDLSIEEIDGLRFLHDVGEAESIAAALEELATRDVDSDRYDAVAAWVQAHIGRRKVAVAASFTNSAICAAQRIEVAFGSHRVATVVESMPEIERMQSVRDFTNDPDRTVIVFDRVGEEGLNLQAVDMVLHLDLPTTVSRLEQRLGRFDRWSDDSHKAGMAPVRSVAFCEQDSSVDEHLGAWRRALDEGIGIFERSTATLQYVLPDVEETFLEVALDAGLVDAGATLIGHRAQLDREARRIAGQDILDAIDDRSDDERFVGQLEALDREHRTITQVFKGYAGDMLGLTVTNTGNGVRFGVSKSNPPLITESTVMALGPARLRVSYEANRQRVRRGSGFLRWGEPLVNAFVNLVLEDDRGRAFIVEVPEAGLDPAVGPLFVFCFDVMVEPGLDVVAELEDADPSAAHAASSQLLRFLAPRIERVWLVPGRGEPPASIVDRLQDRKGTNLGSRPERLEELTQGRGWKEHCEREALVALRVVANRSSVQSRLATARTNFSRSRDRERATAAARIRAGGDPAIDEHVMDVVDAALGEPRVAIDSCGAVILTSRNTTT